MSTSPRKRSRSAAAATGAAMVPELFRDPELRNNNNMQAEEVGCSRTRNNGGSSSNGSLSLLQAWLQHDDVGFHQFTTDEAAQIRSQLLNWYVQHRRKLPWRGDPPPWQGSTANFAAEKQKQSQNGKNNQQPKQTSLKQFFFRATNKDELRWEECEGSQRGLLPQQQSYPVTAYGVWVSEIMLQQTRVEAVVAKWCQWMTSFPTVETLAAATPEAVNAHWAGLGFYRRARLLHTAAQYVVHQLDGAMPTTVEGLMKLPGVGRYTASAVASMAYNVSVPVVDGNVCRVLARLRNIAQTIKATPFKDGHGWDLAAQIVGQGTDNGDAGQVNQALMELGATYCAPAGTGVDPLDPLRDFYWSTRLGQEVADFLRNGGSVQDLLEQATAEKSSGNDNKASRRTCPVCASSGVHEAVRNLCTLLTVETETKEPLSGDAARKCGHGVFPLAPPKTNKKEDVLAVAAISRADTWLLVRRPEAGLLAGQWEFPAACVWTSTSSKLDTKPKKGSKRPDMSDQVPIVAAAVCRKAINTLLNEIMATTIGTHASSLLKFQRVSDAPLEHIFSHVRHTMWVEHAVWAAEDHHQKEQLMAWVDAKGREIRWMSESDMQQVGVTSGVKKILKAVKDQRERRGAKPSRRVGSKATIDSKPSSSRKRPR